MEAAGAFVDLRTYDAVIVYGWRGMKTPLCDSERSSGFSLLHPQREGSWYFPSILELFVKHHRR